MTELCFSGRVNFSIRSAALLLTSALVLSACNNTETVKTPDPVDITVLGLNDFHGNLEPTAFTKVGETAPIKAGGVAAIAAEVNAAKQVNANTVLVGGGDLIGASPTTSTLLRDEPSVIAMNKIGMQVSALGNHEFDQGLKELLRMQNGGCDSNDAAKACQFMPVYPGASFKWIGANVEYKASANAAAKSPFQPYLIQTIGGAKVAFIGAVTTETLGIVSPDGIKDLNFLDEAESVNKYIPELKAQKVDAIIMLIHEGGEIVKGKTVEDTDTYATVGCKTLDPDSPIVKIAKKIDPAVSAIISGHSHKGYNCLVPDPQGNERIVIQGDFYGHLLQRLDVKVDKANHKVMEVKANNLVVDYSAREAAGTLNPEMLTLVSEANAKTLAVKSVFIANLSVPQITYSGNDRTIETPLGDVVADSQLAATQAQGAQIALMNPGGIRQDLPTTANIKPNNAVNFGDVLTVQPFGNTMVVGDLTGQQIKDLLEEQWIGKNAAPSNKLLQLSNGLSYKYTDSAPVGSKINIADIMFAGKPIDPAASYRVAYNSFLAAGGDNFSVFTQAKNIVQLPNLVDVDALNAYLKANGSTLTNTVKGRITKM